MLPNPNLSAEPNPPAGASDLYRALARLGDAVKAKPAAAITEATNPALRPTAKVIPLPPFANAAPPAPNAVLRSALFPAIQSRGRRIMNRFDLIASVDGVEVRMVLGEQFNQDDLGVLLVLEELARAQQPDALACQISERGLLKRLGRQSGGPAEGALLRSLMRLTQPIMVKTESFLYAGGFLHHVYRDERTKQYVVELNAKLGALLRTGWTALDIDIRRKLVKRPLALWLQAFFASHEKPYPYKVETLRELSGGQTAELRKFRQSLKAALDAWTATGDIAGWSIDQKTDLVHISKQKKLAPPRP